MKKAKLMLSAIAIFAVLGTAFAFNAKKYDSHILFVQGTGAAGTCTVSASGLTIGGTAAQVYASTQSLSTNCPLNNTEVINDGN